MKGVEVDRRRRNQKRGRERSKPRVEGEKYC